LDIDFDDKNSVLITGVDCIISFEILTEWQYILIFQHTYILCGKIFTRRYLRLKKVIINYIYIIKLKNYLVNKIYYYF